MTLLTKEQILSSDDLDSVTLDVPEWAKDGQIKLAMMSGFARDRFEVSCMGKKGGTDLVNFRARLVAACAVDENNNLLFDEKDIIKLGNKSGAVLDRLYDASTQLNKLSDKDIEDIAKKS